MDRPYALIVAGEAGKATRNYDSTRRRQQAQENRDAILDAARRLFLADGYTATRISAIAGHAGVSVETVYKAFGDKPGVVHAIADTALAGPDAVPTTQRSDAMGARQTNPIHDHQAMGRVRL